MSGTLWGSVDAMLNGEPTLKARTRMAISDTMMQGKQYDMSKVGWGPG